MAEEQVSRHFIEQEIDKDLAEGVYDHVVTRFPPEPIGYLHIGHAKSIILNSGMAEEYGGKFNLRFDDTNPTKEKEEFVDSITEDVRWLGADFGDRILFASDYFQKMYECAVQLIRDGKAYVCELTADEIRETRGTLTEPGTNSPYRDRPVEENLALFERMRAGEVEDGAVLSERPSCTYAYYQSDIKQKPAPLKKKGWICSVCGYVHEGNEPPEKCPQCVVPGSKLKEEAVQTGK